MIFESIIPLWIVITLAALLAAALVFCLIKKSFRTKQNFRLIAILFLGVLMLARPQFPGGKVETRDNNIDVYFAVDTTGSMVGKDMKDNKRRLEQAKEDIITIAKQIPGARYTVFAQSAVSYQATPLLSDLDALQNAADGLFYPITNASSGTSLSDLLDLVTDKATENKEKYDRPRIFFFLSDGEESDGSKTSIPKNLGDAFTAGVVIGYGTTSGATVATIKQNYCYKDPECEEYTINDDDPVREYGRDSSGYKKSSDHISKLDEDNLENIADATKAKYYTRNDISDLESITKDILNNGEVKTSGSKEGYVDCYFVIAGVIILLLFWTLSDLIVKLLSERKVSND